MFYTVMHLLIATMDQIYGAEIKFNVVLIILLLAFNYKYWHSAPILQGIFQSRLG